jgi:hypothetical protein
MTANVSLLQPHRVSFGDKGNLCTYAQIILTGDGLKKEGHHSGGPKSLDVHRRGRRCDYRKAVNRRGRCDRRHRHGSLGEGTPRPSRGSAQQTGPQRALHKRLGIRIYIYGVSNGSVTDGHGFR